MSVAFTLKISDFAPPPAFERPTRRENHLLTHAHINHNNKQTEHNETNTQHSRSALHDQGRGTHDRTLAHDPNTSTHLPQSRWKKSWQESALHPPQHDEGDALDASLPRSWVSVVRKTRGRGEKAASPLAGACRDPHSHPKPSAGFQGAAGRRGAAPVSRVPVALPRTCMARGNAQGGCTSVRSQRLRPDASLLAHSISCATPARKHGP